jgi:flagellar hook-length control protein FliK
VWVGPQHAQETRAPTHTAVVRGSPETVAHLSAQILKKLEARSTRFDLELNPANLGRVDVRIEIGAHGRVTAALTFDNPQAAQDLRGKAAELQRSLEQAGFDLSGGLTFDVAQDRGQGQGQGLAQQQQDAAPWRGRAFQAALGVTGEADAAAAAPQYLERRASGVDVRI